MSAGMCDFAPLMTDTFMQWPRMEESGCPQDSLSPRSASGPVCV